jgi:glycosyltransferase involved in cell wall biosynthesis
VVEKQIENIIFHGNLEGHSKHKIFVDSDILLFPTFAEGLPLTVLEAMLYGLPIITRPVGGIPDIVKDGENGYLIESFTAKDYADKIMMLSNDENLYGKISLNNQYKAKHEFTPDVLRSKLDEVYSNAMGNYELVS